MNTLTSPGTLAQLANMVRTGVITKEEALALIGSAAAADELLNAIEAGNLIDHVDQHIKKVDDVCPSGSPDPNDPDQDPVKGWIKEVKAGLKNLQQKLKKMPKNKEKRKPVEKSIERTQEALKRWGQE